MRTNAERCKEYYQRNKEKRKAASLDYYIRNKENVRAKKNAKNRAASASGRTAYARRLERAYKSPEYYVIYLHEKVRKSAKDRKKEFTLTVEDLMERIIACGGFCEISGIALTIQPNNTNTISVDRIDSSKGYTKNNIRICSVQANWSKHKMSDKQFLVLCESVLTHNGYTVRK
jgi:hypothetical protein